MVFILLSSRLIFCSALSLPPVLQLKPSESQRVRVINKFTHTDKAKETLYCNVALNLPAVIFSLGNASNEAYNVLVKSSCLSQ